jgi:cell division protein FtsW
MKRLRPPVKPVGRPRGIVAPPPDRLRPADLWTGPTLSPEQEKLRAKAGPRVSQGILDRQATVLQDPGVLKRQAHEPDYVILVAVAALCAIGLLMVYSASAIPSYALSDNTFQLLAPQVIAGLLGVVAMIFLMRLDYRYLREISLPLLLLALVMLLIVVVPIGPLKALSVTHNGSTRWIHLGFFPDVAPAEICKVALIVYLSHWLATKGTQIRSVIHGAVPYAIIVLPFLFLVYKEPDLGTTSVLLLIAFTLWFAAGARLWQILVAVVGGGSAGFFLMLDVGLYPVERIRCLFDPWSDAMGNCYQTVKGLEALSAGGFFGIGLGNSKVNVPEDVNDFIFSIIAQEMGLAGGALVVLLFIVLAYAGIRTALRAPDTFGGLMAAGITAWLCFQALINVGVVVAVLPVTGITLPFVSAGGSSLTVSLAAVGILLSISRETVERGWMSASADSGRGYGGTYLPGSRRGSITAG